jgi:hypothetical protein
MLPSRSVVVASLLLAGCGAAGATTDAVPVLASHPEPHAVTPPGGWVSWSALLASGSPGEATPEGALGVFLDEIAEGSAPRPRQEFHS